MQIDFSVIVCSYNPDDRIFERCLNAISKLKVSDLTYEIIIIDNNSTPSLSSRQYVELFLESNFDAKILLEYSQGLLAARIRGINEAKGKNVVFFDDDNEPENDYLLNIKVLTEKYREVGAWGPGIVNVDFIDGVDEDIESYSKYLFQERRDSKEQYGNSRSIQSYYPYGTGLCVELDLLQSYIRQVDDGIFTLKGRNGELLSSGEDTQIVLNCIANGRYVGRSPMLKIKHIIPKKRVEYNNLKRLIRGMNISYDISIAEVFPEHLQDIKPRSNMFAIFVKVAFKYVKARLSASRNRKLKTIRYLSLIESQFIGRNDPVPSWLTWTVKSLLKSS